MKDSASNCANEIDVFTVDPLVIAGFNFPVFSVGNAFSGCV
jgi:hypothetical protein